MKKDIKTILSLIMVFSIIVSNTSKVNAHEIIVQENYTNPEIEQLMNVNSNSDEVNRDVESSKESIMIADGYEAYIDVPIDINKGISISDGLGETLNFSLPIDTDDYTETLENDDTVICSENNSNVAYGIQAMKIEGDNDVTMEGVRTNIFIENASAPKEYEFTYDLSEGDRLVTSAEFLGEEYDTGEVYILGRDNELKYIIDAPWAKDANGNTIDTKFKIKNNKLIQIVEFNDKSIFPIVADPSVYQVIMCVASIAAIIASTYFVAAKLVKIKKYIKTLGGLKEAVSLLIGATTGLEKRTAVMKAVGGLAAEILGVDAVVSNCPGIKSTYNKIKKKLTS